MIFLLEYDRQAGRLVDIQEFDDGARDRASKLRLELELDLLRQGISHEVVLLEAASIEDLRGTHSRYFRNFGDMAKSAKDLTKASDSKPPEQN
ncbi:MAG TPA: hypothetical protein VJ806_16595 [Luteimonas sp.]|nr:hypothetical protein [Luteimonas sp.]